MADVILLNAFPFKMVRLACKRCDRKGQYTKANLIEEYGAGIQLPTLLSKIAKCDQHNKLDSACGVYYVGLAPKDG